MNEKKSLSVPEAARQLGFTLKYVYDLVHSGRMNATKIAGRWRIPIGEVAAWPERRQRHD